MTVLITGGAGFCGRRLARRLRAGGGVRLCGLGRNAGIATPPEYDEWAAVDVSQSDAVGRMVRAWQPDWIFHLAGQTTGNAEDIHRTNLLGTVAVLEAVRQHATGAKLLLAGSAAEYGPVGPTQLPVSESQPCQPTGPYGISKYAATLAGLDYVRRCGLKIVVARPFNIIGPGIPASLVVGAMLARVKTALREGADEIAIGNLEAERDFVGIDDVVEAYSMMIQGECWGEVFNVCSGQPRRIADVVSDLIARAPVPLRLRMDPALMRPAEVAVIYGSYEKARRVFGFTPRENWQSLLSDTWGAEMAGVGPCA